MGSNLTSTGIDNFTQDSGRMRISHNRIGEKIGRGNGKFVEHVLQSAQAPYIVNRRLAGR
jgi:hypothetical protein